MIGVIDYGVGNLFSLCSSLRCVGAEVQVSADPAVLEQADKLVLPGVGAFGDAADKLRATGLDQLVIRQAKKGVPVLGICLGMQLLFEESLEYGRHKGLGLLAGRVVPMEGVLPAELKIPHIGWNALQPGLRRQSGGHGGVRHPHHRHGAEGERDGLPVPPGKERPGGPCHSAGLL